jgi:DNA-binding winged helix-turn-helix (wHTH) protein
LNDVHGIWREYNLENVLSWRSLLADHSDVNKEIATVRKMGFTIGRASVTIPESKHNQEGHVIKTSRVCP